MKFFECLIVRDRTVMGDKVEGAIRIKGMSTMQRPFVKFKQQNVLFLMKYFLCIVIMIL